MPVRVIPQNEPDNTIATATPTGLIAGTVEIVSADAEINPQTDLDLYQVTIAAGQRITVRINSSDVFSNPAINVGLDSLITLLDAAGNPVPGVTNDDFDGLDSYFETAPLAAGTYFVRVEEFANNSTGSYRIFINNDTQANNATAGADAIVGDGNPNLLVGGAGN